ncbi:hypothetical protein OEZ85_008093 [Tetradesmus obliquus]|uniref:F-box/LRR-repeat protein 15-like leucin rich repeat domain-containing protein n=1 Tax=Tetradesmus obliquus TaxID=3088 RepID=A0ABY8THU9_TETOB|nr:hypothetical protein OEZ85_008093 [Tetradesmus obliquus]
MPAAVGSTQSALAGSARLLVRLHKVFEPRSVLFGRSFITAFALGQMAVDQAKCSKCDWSTSCSECCSPCVALDSLPDSLVQQHLLPRLSSGDKKVFRMSNPRQRQLVNQSVRTVLVPASALNSCPAGTTLGEPFPAAHTLKAYDWEDASITDDALIKFLAGSEQWLGSLGEVNIKKCHHVTRMLLAFLRSACPKLRKLAPSRWADHSALRDIAAFPCLEELDLGDPDADIITIDDLGLTALTGLSHSLRRLGLSRCRWVSDAAFATLAQLHQLQVLDLSHTDVGPRGLAALAGLPNLHTINLTGCRNVTDEALAELARIPSLAHITLKGSLATNDGLQLLRALPRLTHLDLGSRWELDDTGLAAVASCPELKVLAAGSFNLVRPACNPKGLAKLEHLSFGGGFANKGLHLLFPLLKLKSLYVQGIDSVTDSVMRHISCSQKQLQHLSLRSGYSLTKDGLTQLAPLANLSVLSVGACPAISRPALEAFTAAHSRLAMLLQGACPLLSDEGEALCALAPEPALASPFLPTVRVS